MVVRVENGQENQATHADNGENYADYGEDLFLDSRVGNQSPIVTQQALSGKRQVEEDSCDSRSRDEERLELAGANVGNEGYVVVRVHVRVVFAIGIDDPVEEEAQEHTKPDEGGEDWKDLKMLVRNCGYCEGFTFGRSLPSRIRSLWQPWRMAGLVAGWLFVLNCIKCVGWSYSIVR